MHKATIEINKVPTTVETWGRWIEEKPSKENEDIIVCIPGNPGVTGYYRRFLQEIYDNLQCPVWIIGHGGHQIIESNCIKVPRLSGNEYLYSTQGQIDHKAAFFKKYVPPGARVHLIGHSVGAYITLNLLKDPEIKSNVQKAYLLFPTIEHLVKTKNGQFMTNIIKYITWLVFFLAWIYTRLPEAVKTFLVYLYFKITFTPTYNIPSTKKLIHPSVLQKIFYMAFDEMERVTELERDLIDSNKDIIKLYYGANDNWAPVSHWENLKQNYPDINAEVCVRNFEHAFVLRSAKDVGNMVAGWIELPN